MAGSTGARHGVPGWIVVAVASTFGVSGLVAGGWLLLGLPWTPELQGDLAVQLIGGALPALAIFAAGGMLALRQRRLADRQLRFTQLGLARDLSGVALEGQDLRGIDLRHKNLRNANLKHADLRDATLLGCDLRGSQLLGADLRGCNLDGADLRLAVLANARLDGAWMHFATARGASFASASMRRFASHGSDFSGLSSAEVETLLAEGGMRHSIHPRRARVSHPNSGARTSLIRISAPGSSWVGTNLRKADLRDADLRSSQLNDEWYTPSFERVPGMTLRNRWLSHKDEWWQARFHVHNWVAGADEPADLSEANLAGADMRYTSLTRVRLVGAEIDTCHFDGGQLALATLVPDADTKQGGGRISTSRWLRFKASLRHVLRPVQQPDNDPTSQEDPEV